MTARFSNAGVNAQAVAVAKLLDGGFFDLMKGNPPEQVDDLISDELRLVRCDLAAVAFGAPSDGLLQANPIAKGVATQTGEPTWCRCVSRSGDVVLDGTAGTSGANAIGNVEMIVKGQIISIKEFKYAINKKSDTIFITG